MSFQSVTLKGCEDAEWHPLDSLLGPGDSHMVACRIWNSCASWGIARLTVGNSKTNRRMGKEGNLVEPDQKVSCPASLKCLLSLREVSVSKY